jgi:uncharacterized protein
MEQEEIISKTKEFVRNKLERDSSGHDWWHINRVWKNSITIGEQEEANMFVIQLAALLHDIADFKFHDGDFSIGPKVARDFLEDLKVEKEVISHVCSIIEDISFKGSGEEKPMKTNEGRIVRDSDRLDAIGAIGIARCFAYGGHKGIPLHNPEIKPQIHQTKEEYIKRQTSQINHFHEKLLLLKDLMLTNTGRKIAEERHRFMESYLDQFHSEWDGNR